MIRPPFENVGRGGKGGARQAEGGCERVAANPFRKIGACRAPRAGGFEPLREAPDEKIVALIPVSAKVRAREPRRREAARIVPLDRLSAQCGFARDVAGVGLDAADRTAKIDPLFRFAEKVWGEAAAEPVRA